MMLLLLCVGLAVLLAPGGCGATQTCCSPTGVPGEQLCCPAGHRCSADGRSCVREGLVQCDSTHYCLDGNTCCKTTTGAWSCCPLPQAVCCDDHIHCCPQGTTCDVAAGSCDSSSSSSSSASVPLFRKVPTLTFTPPLPPLGREEVVCDGTHRCPGLKTCCRNPAGLWSCCPLVQGVCCPDGRHCCPSGTTCDLTSSSCMKQSDFMPMWRHEPAVMVMAMGSREPMEVLEKEEVEEEQETEEEETGPERVIPCDDHTSCNDGNTCCSNGKQNKKWFCCPLPQAVCCDHGRHCCPSGSQCGEHHECNAGGATFPWYTSVAASSRQKKLRGAPLAPPTSPPLPTSLSIVRCDDESSCEDGQTCCRTSATTWGCCPLPNAVCCSDKQRCCPSGSICTEEGCDMKPRPYWRY